MKTLLIVPVGMLSLIGLMSFLKARESKPAPTPARIAVSASPAPGASPAPTEQAHSLATIDREGDRPYPSTIEAIENTVYGKLTYAMVTFGPYMDGFNGKDCATVKVAFRVEGDPRPHCAIIHEQQGFGP